MHDLPGKPIPPQPYPGFCRLVFGADLAWAVIGSVLHVLILRNQSGNLLVMITAGVMVVIALGRIVGDLLLLCRIKAGLVIGLIAVCFDGTALLATAAQSDIFHPLVILILAARLLAIVFYSVALHDLYRHFNPPRLKTASPESPPPSYHPRKRIRRIKVSHNRRTPSLPPTPPSFSRYYVITSLALALPLALFIGMPIVFEGNITIGDIVMGIIVSVVMCIFTVPVVFGYLAPFGIAAHRGVGKWRLIGLLNVFAGWTLVVWFVILLWALQAKPAEPPTTDT